MPVKKKNNQKNHLSSFFIVSYIVLIVFPLVFHFTYIKIPRLESNLLIQEFANISKISPFRLILYTFLVSGTCINFLLAYSITMIYNKIEKDNFSIYIGYGFGLLSLVFFFNIIFFMVGSHSDANIFVLLKHFFFLVRAYYGLVLFGCGLFVIVGNSIKLSSKKQIINIYYIILFVSLIIDFILIKTNVASNGFIKQTLESWIFEGSSLVLGLIGIVLTWLYCIKNKNYFKIALALGLIPLLFSYLFAIAGSDSVMDKSFFTSYLFIFISSFVILIGTMYTSYQTNNNALSMIDAKQRFLANMSHELRTPINAISGATELLLEEPVVAENEDVKEMLKAVKDSSDHLFEIISDILEYSNLEHGLPKPHFEALDVSAVIKELLLKFEAKAASKDLQFNIFIDPNLPSHLVTDKKYFMILLAQLIDNAIKFTGSGSVVCTAKKIESSSRTRIQVEVRDTGVGIEKSKIDKLFDEFSQVDNSSTRAYEGLGLGLAICRKVVKLLNGKMSIKSEIGSGSVFSIELPLKLKQK